MDKHTLEDLLEQFNSIMQTKNEIEFWYARELQQVLGYTNWNKFSNVLDRAIDACKTSGIEVSDHFYQVVKMIKIANNATREIRDIMLTRYACYLIAQNGDSKKEQIAFAQTYFALQTRKQELLEKYIEEQYRVNIRYELTQQEKKLSSLIEKRVGVEGSFARIRSKGDKALFGGNDTKTMKNKLQVPDTRPLADFLPSVTINAKNLAMDITNINIEQKDLYGEPPITDEHVQNNIEIRDLLIKRGVYVERLDKAKDIKKIERKIKSNAQKLLKNTKNLNNKE